MRKGQRIHSYNKVDPAFSDKAKAAAEAKRKDKNANRLINVTRGAYHYYDQPTLEFES